MDRCPDGALQRLRQVVLAANASLLVGVADGALALTAEYVSYAAPVRQAARVVPGGRPASRRRLHHGAGDARPRHSTPPGGSSAGLDARRDVEVAAFWAADGWPVA